MTGKPVGMAIAHPVPLVGRSEEDVGATVVGVVDALHPGVVMRTPAQSGTTEWRR